MTKTETFKLALEALEWATSCMSFEDFDDMPEALEELNKAHQAITAIKEALAQPEQHQDWCASLTQLLMSMPPKPAPCNCKPSQRTWVGLTDDEREQVYKIWRFHPSNETNFHLCKAIEAKLKEKNT